MFVVRQQNRSSELGLRQSLVIVVIPSDER